MTTRARNGTDSITGRRKRHFVFWIAGALMLILAVLLAGWVRVSQGRLKREVEDLRRAGEPMLPEEFASPAVPDAANAIIDLRAAAASINGNDPRYLALAELDPLLPLKPGELAVITAAVEANSAALADVDLAMAKPGVDWQISLKTPVVTVLLPDLNLQRPVVIVLAADLLYAHQRGDDARALRRAMQIRFIARAFSRQPFMVSQLVSMGLSSTASNRLMQIAPDLKVGGSGGATPSQIKTAIDALLTRDAEDAGVLLALRGERMMHLDAIQAVMDGKITMEFLLTITGNGSANSKTPLAYSFRPLLAEDARFDVRYMTQIIDEINHGVPADLPTFRANKPKLPNLDTLLIQHRLSRMILPGTGRYFEQHYRRLTDNHLAATALAIRWYRVDHRGEFPAKLSDLVPQYLPAVPTDPMAAGRPLGYIIKGLVGAPSSEAARDPIIYSVGANGTDEGGSETPTKPTNGESPPWDGVDVVVHLTPQARRQDADEATTIPATAPTTNPSGH